MAPYIRFCKISVFTLLLLLFGNSHALALQAAGCTKDDALSWLNVRLEQESQRGWQIAEGAKVCCKERRGACSGEIDGYGNWGYVCEVTLCSTVSGSYPHCPYRVYQPSCY